MENDKITNEQTSNHFFSFKIIIILMCIICIGVGIYGLKKIIQYEKLQNERIQTLQDLVVKLKNDIEVLSNNKKEIEYLDDGFNFLAIGNSITIHQKSSYWWNEIGMAATDKDKDYVHLVANYINKKIKTKFYAYNFSNWEIISYDRGELLNCIEEYMSDKLDLVILQLSENVVNLDTYKRDYEDLIKYINNNSPNAKIIMIDDFWNNDIKIEIKKEICKDFNLDFVDLSEIKNDKNYQSSLGTKVYDEQGKEHIIDHKGVSEHPGDKGMQYIADKIIEKLNYYFE